MRLALGRSCSCHSAAHYLHADAASPTQLPALCSQRPPACDLLHRPLPPPSLHAQWCPTGSPQYHIGAGVREPSPGRAAPKGCSLQDRLPAAAGSTEHRGYSLPTPTAPAGEAIIHLLRENTSLCGKQVLIIPWTWWLLCLRSPEEEEGAGGSPCPASQKGRRKRREGSESRWGMTAHPAAALRSPGLLT